MTSNANNAPEMTGLEIIAQNLPSYNENENNDAQGLQLQETRDAAESEIPFGRDDAEEDRSSNQTRGLFNKRGMMILLCIAAIVFLCLVTGLSSAVFWLAATAWSLIPSNPSVLH